MADDAVGTPPKAEEPENTPQEQPKGTVEGGKVLEVEVVGQDPQTGAKFRDVVKIDLDTEEGLKEVKNYVQKGHRFEAKMGALNAEAMAKAKEMFETLNQAQREHMFALARAGKKTDESGERIPTFEEMQENPELFAKFLNEHDGKLRAAIMAEFDKKRAEDQEEARYYEEMKASIREALQLYPHLDQEVFIDVLKSKNAGPDQVLELAGKLNEKLFGKINVDKLPPAEKKKILEEAANKISGPGAPPSGEAPQTPQRVPTSFDDIEEMERERARSGR